MLSRIHPRENRHPDHLDGIDPQKLEFEGHERRESDQVHKRPEFEGRLRIPGGNATVRAVSLTGARVRIYVVGVTHTHTRRPPGEHVRGKAAPVRRTRKIRHMAAFERACTAARTFMAGTSVLRTSWRQDAGERKASAPMMRVYTELYTAAIGP